MPWHLKFPSLLMSLSSAREDVVRREAPRWKGAHNPPWILHWRLGRVPAYSSHEGIVRELIWDMASVIYGKQCPSLVKWVSLTGLPVWCSRRSGIFQPECHSTWCAPRTFKTCSSRLLTDTDLFPLKWSNKKMTTANTTIAIWCEYIKIIPIFLSDWQKIHNFMVCHRSFVVTLRVPWDWKRRKITDTDH